MQNNITAGDNYTLHLGDNLATLKTYPDNIFDSIVCDPPYFIDFLGKDWDSNKSDFTPLFKECLRVLKPGGYMLAFSAARTYHKLATQVETAGFEIRDQLMWLYSSGFPKAQDIGKAIQKRLGVEETAAHKYNQPGIANSNDVLYKENSQTTVCTSPLAKEWEGFKTALKPAHEPIVMARKPYKGSTIDNVLKNGLGAMNIDATRVPWADAADAEAQPVPGGTPGTFNNILTEAQGGERWRPEKKKKSDKPKPQLNPTMVSAIGGGDENVTSDTIYEPADGRYPSNVIGEVAEGYQKTDIQKYFFNPAYTAEEVIPEVEEGYAKFKYCPKVSRKERHVGFDIGYRLIDGVNAKIEQQIKDALK